MDNKLSDLNNKIRDFNLGCKAKTITIANVQPYVNEIINMFVEFYKDDDFYVYIPYYESGPAIYQEQERLYVPVYSDVGLINNPDVVKTKKVKFKDVCSGLYKNITIYELLDNIEGIFDSDYSLSEILEYTSHNAKLDGIMYNPDTVYIFGFDGWQFKALMFKGMGADEFNVVDANTGEVTNKL